MGGTGSLTDFIGRHIPLPLPIPDWSKPIILVLLLLCVGFGVRARITSIRARRLEHQQLKLAADLDSMQAALVPEIPSRLGELKISVAYRPADGPAAGGDFYDAFALESGRVAIVLGDVSGHGRAALARATHMRYTLRAYFEAGLDPRAALKLAGRVLGAAEDDLFTTVALAVYDASAASLTYATAGHPSPLTLGRPAHEPVTSCASPALGWGAPTGRRQTTIPFPKGACACFFSDGLTEAHTDDGLLGRRRLAQIFAELGPQPSARALLERVRDDAQEIRDDMAACIIEAAIGTVLTETWVEELEVDLEQLASGQGERFLEACGVTPDEIVSVIARARVFASDHGLALLAVELAAGSSTATASALAAIRPATPADVKSEAVSARSLEPPAKAASARSTLPTPV